VVWTGIGNHIDRCIVRVFRMSRRMQFRSVSSVPVIGDAAGPKMAIPLARSAHDEPLESFPFRIAERRKR